MSEEHDVPQTEDHPIPGLLKVTYVVLLVGGILAFFLYWNGSHGWLDRGYWSQLQKAAGTTYPFEKPEPAIELPTDRS